MDVCVQHARYSPMGFRDLLWKRNAERRTAGRPDGQPDRQAAGRIDIRGDAYTPTLTSSGG